MFDSGKPVFYNISSQEGSLTAAVILYSSAIHMLQLKKLELLMMLRDSELTASFFNFQDKKRSQVVFKSSQLLNSIDDMGRFAAEKFD